jgi:23S rRNA pseudouridine2605 synthase
MNDVRVSPLRNPAAMPPESRPPRGRPPRSTPEGRGRTPPRGAGSRRPFTRGRDADESRPRTPAAADDGLERLQKVLAAAGLGSRRACEELITTGRVEVDRQVVTTLGSRVDPHAQEIRVDGERLPNPKRVVYMLNKPVGVVTTNFDPSGRPRVVDLVPGDQRLFAIGRLDRMSEGLILITNDGGLANLLAHPRYGVEKKYLVQVAGVPSEELIDRLHRGIRLAEAEVHAKRVSIRSQHKQSAVLEMVLDEGKNREIRRMLASLGHKVHQLKRVAVGNLSLGNLLPGQWRQLAWSEIESLRRDAIAAVGADAERESPPTRGPGRGPIRGRRPGGPPPRRPGRPDQPARPGRPPRGRPAGDGRGQAGGQAAARPGAGKPRGVGSSGPAGGKPRGGGQGRPLPRKRKRAGKASTWRARPSGGTGER